LLAQGPSHFTTPLIATLIRAQPVLAQMGHLDLLPIAMCEIEIAKRLCDPRRWHATLGLWAR